MVQQCVENIMNIQEAYMYIHCHVTSVTAVPGLIPLNSHTQWFTATGQNQIVIRHDRCDHICLDGMEQATFLRLCVVIVLITINSQS